MVPNFGAPPPPRPAFSYRMPTPRKPGVGDHVCIKITGDYVGLIVDLQPGGWAKVARRSRLGASTIELDFLLDTLAVSPITPISGNEDLDPNWKRGALG